MNVAHEHARRIGCVAATVGVDRCAGRRRRDSGRPLDLLATSRRRRGSVTPSESNLAGTILANHRPGTRSISTRPDSSDSAVAVAADARRGANDPQVSVRHSQRDRVPHDQCPRRRPQRSHSGDQATRLWLSQPGALSPRHLLSSRPARSLSRTAGIRPHDSLKRPISFMTLRQESRPPLPPIAAGSAMRATRSRSN